MLTRTIRQLNTHILVTIVFLSLLILAITGVIAAEQHQWKLTADSTKCFTDPQAGCYLVQNSAYAESFGIPNTLMSLVGFIGVITVTILLLLGKGPQQYLEWALVGMLGIGAMFALWFLYVQYALLNAYCTFCLPIDFLSLFLFAIALARFCTLKPAVR